jgi:hypothetical protein
MVFPLGSRTRATVRKKAKLFPRDARFRGTMIGLGD